MLSATLLSAMLSPAPCLPAAPDARATRTCAATCAAQAEPARNGEDAQRGDKRTERGFTMPTFGIQIGDLVDHTFSSPLHNGLGTHSLDDLRGKPVMIDFWGVRCHGCIAAAVPSALKLQETFGDELQVILVECQASSPEAAIAFALGQKWLGGRAMWTSERPFDTGSGSLPQCVLLDREGHVLLKGNPTALHKEIERQIAAQIELGQSPPPDADPVARPAWSEFARGRYARAFRAAGEAEAQHAGDPARLAELARARAAFRARLVKRIERVRWLADNAWYDEADSALDTLAAGLRGSGEHAACLAELRTKLADPKLAVDRSAARHLARLRARFYESGGDAAAVRELERFAKEHAKSQTGERALELVRLAGDVKSAR